LVSISSYMHSSAMHMWQDNYGTRIVVVHMPISIERECYYGPNSILDIFLSGIATIERVVRHENSRR